MLARRGSQGIFLILTKFSFLFFSKHFQLKLLKGFGNITACLCFQDISMLFSIFHFHDQIILSITLTLVYENISHKWRKIIHSKYSGPNETFIEFHLFPPQRNQSIKDLGKTQICSTKFKIFLLYSFYMVPDKMISDPSSICDLPSILSKLSTIQIYSVPYRRPQGKSIMR